jgi:hypothetical protein
LSITPTKRIAVLLLLLLFLCSAVYADGYESLANSLLYKSEVGLRRLEILNMSSNRIADLVNEAELLLSSAKYESSANISAEALRLEELSQNVTSINSYMLLLLASHSRLGLNTSLEEKMLDKARNEIAKENFELAYAAANQARLNLEKKIIAAKQNMLVLLSELNSKAMIQNISVNRVKWALEKGRNIREPTMIVSFYDEGLLINKSLSCIIDYKVDIASLQKNIPIPFFKELLLEQVMLFEKENYQKAIELCSHNRKLAADAQKTYLQLKNLSAEINASRQKMINVEKPMMMVVQAKQLLDLNQVNESQSLAGEAKTALENTISDDMLFSVVSKSELSFGLRQFIVKHWLILIFTILIASMIAVVSYQSFSLWNNQRIFMNLIHNELALKDLMKKLQKRYFIDRKMTRESYDSQMDSLQLRMVSTRAKLAGYKNVSQTKKLDKPSRIKLKVIGLLKFLLSKLESEEREKFKSK